MSKAASNANPVLIIDVGRVVRAEQACMKRKREQAEEIAKQDALPIEELATLSAQTQLERRYYQQFCNLDQACWMGLLRCYGECLATTEHDKWIAEEAERGARRRLEEKHPREYSALRSAAIESIIAGRAERAELRAAERYLRVADDCTPPDTC